MRESRWQQFDFVIVACVLGLVLAGVAMIHSATCGSPCTGLLPPSSYAVRQGVSAAVGFALLVGVSLIDYRFYRVYAYHLFGFAVALLVLVLLIGRGGADDDYGSKRWIYLGAVRPAGVGSGQAGGAGRAGPRAGRQARRRRCRSGG